MSTVSGDTKTIGEAGVTGIFDQDPRILDPRDFAAGVLGLAVGQPAVWGIASGGAGVFGLVEGAQSPGVFGQSVPDDNDTSGVGVHGAGAIGVVGDGDVGVKGNGRGGTSNGFLGGNDPVFHQLAGVYGESAQQGVMGLTKAPGGTGVYGGGTAAADGKQIGVRGETLTGVGVQGESFDAAGLAGRFVGDVEVTGDIRLASRDLAEQFEVDSRRPCEAGMVMVIGELGALSPCHQAYDRRAVGVISGAGNLHPAITLGAVDNHATPTASIALAGTAFCLVDADFGAIEPGDLITSSETSGHAMKANDPSRSFGSIVGKALAPLPRGRGLVPILIALQ
jgi:hypothetical protein